MTATPTEDRAVVRLTGEGWKSGTGGFQHGGLYGVRLSTRRGLSYELLTPEGRNSGRYCWLDPADSYSGEFVEETPQLASGPEPLILSELDAVRAVLTKLEALEFVRGNTELTLSDVKIPILVGETLLGEFSFNYEYDSWVFTPAMRKEAQDLD